MATGWRCRMTHAKVVAAELLSVTVYPTSPPSFSRAEMLGIVVSLESKPKFLKFLLDDGTGCVPCILWLHPLLPPSESDHDPTPELLRHQARTVRLGEQLRVRGRITVYRGQLQITVRDVFVEKDPNMETFHRLDCVRIAKRCYHPS
ncbi:hypothetical protein LUZ63_019790 [Rhynchospora breviuscula]|uniref:CST complex subunit STN1 n=1 Tax=Rhynchospora breviuscula TaxID=2022672 RepID=A0A9Q0C732_9POAL|nr:hypothetical protein LUZ63_019790 [Rhynchospora breviuscula]